MQMRSVRLAGVILSLVMCASNAALPPCPDTPNCVSSQATDSRQYIEPFPYSGDPAAAMARLRASVTRQPRIKIVREEGGALQVEARSLLFRFVDDIMFIIDKEHNVIHVRAAARSGYHDLGVNRRRIERIRRDYLSTP